MKYFSDASFKKSFCNLIRNVRTKEIFKCSFLASLWNITSSDLNLFSFCLHSLQKFCDECGAFLIILVLANFEALRVVFLNISDNVRTIRIIQKVPEQQTCKANRRKTVVEAFCTTARSNNIKCRKFSVGNTITCTINRNCKVSKIFYTIKTWFVSVIWL
jgi:hypothetical protein